VLRFNAGLSLLHPEARGWVKLRSADPRDQARVFYNLLGARADLDALVRAIRIAREIYAQEPQKSMIAGELFPGARNGTDAELEEIVRRSVSVTQHPTGTCAMGIGPQAVVDPQLRVYGVERLRVADASIMPTVPGGNTNVPTIRVGEKASDLIRGRVLAPAEL
jgi:choline dehydrogenase